MNRPHDPATPPPDWPEAQVLEALSKTWGYDTLRPQQAEAIHAGLTGRDSLVVLPTGGGKSLCYQLPPLITGRTDVVISPLISLMKDQVDGLRAAGYPAAAIHSNCTPEEIAEAERDLMAGKLRLIYMAPERLFSTRLPAMLAQVQVGAIAIDEAHCISHWGHDFRPEYRKLASLKERLPGAALHAFTATATPRVREDIADQLGLRDPALLVGIFDRPNLIYRVVPKVDARAQVAQVLLRHGGEAAIVYCISRKETESLASALVKRGIQAEAYHAGMAPEERRRIQDAFSEERLDVVVATVAFGMGIDRSNVRCVVHAGIPKSLEHYQQESGRAGRDGLAAECVLLYSAADAFKWRSLIERSCSEADDPQQAMESAVELLRHVENYARGLRCRHKSLSEYFGQSLEGDACGACDVCMGEVEGVEDGTVTAQKLLSNVYRVARPFGITYLAEILAGGDTEQVRRWAHQELTTYGLLKGTPRSQIVNWYYQLLEQDLLAREGGDRPTLSLNQASMEVLKGDRQVQLLRAAAKAPRRTKIDREGWEGVDRDLFDHLRDRRREIADELDVPAYIVFGDATLRTMAAARPSTLPEMLAIKGIGERKLERFGQQFLDAIDAYAEDPILPDESPEVD